MLPGIVAGPGNRMRAASVTTEVRALVVLAMTPVLVLALALPAAASCRPPEPVSENAARAVLVVHGTVTGVDSGAVIFRVDQVLKGSAASTLRVFVGPGREGSGGGIAATSVDYSATVGTDHVLYVIKGENGQLETNACTGSHPGAPSAEETALFGPGSSPDPTSGLISTIPGGADTPFGWADPWAVVAALAVLVATIILGRRALVSRSTEH